MEASAALAGPKMPKASLVTAAEDRGNGWPRWQARRSVPIVLAFLASAAAATYWAPVSF